MTTVTVKRWYDPRFRPLEMEQRPPFVKLGDESILAFGNNCTMVSKDGGKTWSAPRPVLQAEDGSIPEEGIGVPWRHGAAVRTRDGVIVWAWSDRRILNWDDATGEPGADARGDVWVIRSLDEGQTWVDRQRVFEGICGHPPINMLQTKGGRIVFPVQFYLRQPGRNAIRTYSSTDNGLTWVGANIIDLGGHGHHDGAFEPTFVQLRNNRLWMLVRTNWDRFWDALSDDEGRSWRVIRPSKIEASTSPGFIKRLESGRLVLLWSRLYPEGEISFPRRSGQFSEAEASWHREELSIAFSEDEGESWSKPIIIAREKGAWLSYPHLFEPEPGLFWIFSGQGDICVWAREDELLGG